MSIQDWLNIGLRWLHLVVGISWIGNSLYFSDRVETKAREVFDPLQKILYLAKSPAPGTGQLTAWNQAASDRVVELKVLLRAELRVVDEGGDDPGKKA